MRLALATVFIALLASCASPADLNRAKTAASEFRALFDEGDSQGVYARASAAYRSATTAQQTADLINTVRYRLGACEPAGDPISMNWNRGTGGYVITLVYERNCAKGPLTETFILNMDGTRPTLQGFNFNSPALLPDPPPTVAPPSVPAPELPTEAPAHPT